MIEQDNVGGFVKLRYGLLNHWLMAESDRLRIFIWMLLKASWQDEVIHLVAGRKPHKVKLKRGQLIFGRKAAASQLNGISEGKIYRQLTAMQTNSIVGIEPNRYFSIVTICKYDSYSDETYYKRHRSVHRTEQQTEQQTDTPKERKKERSKEVKNIRGNRKHSFHDSPYFDKVKFAEAFEDDKYADVDIKYWYERAEEYSASSGTKYLDWPKALKGWIRKAREDGKAKHGFKQRPNTPRIPMA